MKKYHAKHKIIAVIALAIAGCSFIGLKNVWADEQITSSMFVTPMSQRILLIPGEKYEGIISVSNAANAQDNLNYLVEVGSYSLTKDENSHDDYGAVDVFSKTGRNEMMDWITLDQTFGTVEPNGTGKIKYVIDVPDNAPAGAQYASILVINNGNGDEIENGGNDDLMIHETYQLASTIIANVAGSTVEKGTIIENSLPSFLLNNSLEATSMVKNEGNVYTDAEYMLQVWPMFSDEEICTNEEEPETSLVLPDTERYHTQTCKLPAVGIFRAKQTVKIFGEESIAEKTIIVCPIWLLFLIIFIIIAIIIWLVMRSKTHKKSRKSVE